MVKNKKNGQKVGQIDKKSYTKWLRNGKAVQ